MGKFSSNFLMASKPPAEAPIPAIGKARSACMLRTPFFLAFFIFFGFSQKNSFLSYPISVRTYHKYSRKTYMIMGKPLSFGLSHTAIQRSYLPNPSLFD